MSAEPLRIALVGAECTGKSTLGAALAGRLPGVALAECLREFCEARGRTPHAHEQREIVEAQIAREREAVAAARALPGKTLRVFPALEPAIRARMQANALSEPVARLLVERGTRQVEGGFVWSSDPRLTLPSFTRLTEAQVRDLVAGIECPVRVIHASPAQPYLPDPVRRAHAAALRDGELIVIPGGHHLHMEQPAEVATAIGDFLAG